MGDRWFSAPTFTTVQDTNRVNVEVRAVGRDASGRKAQIAPEWVSADPKMVSVSPARGSEVTITVHRAGEYVQMPLTAAVVAERFPLVTRHRPAVEATA